MKSRNYSSIESALELIKKFVKSKDAFHLVMKTLVHLALDKGIVSEGELRKMFDDSVKSWSKSR